MGDATAFPFVKTVRRMARTMRFYFKPKVTFVCLLLAALMLRASVWQWHRHTEKQLYIAELSRNLEQDIVPLTSLLAANEDWTSLLHRRVGVEGEFDFAKEVVLRNRKYQDFAGVHVLTPLRIAGTAKYVLVSRGFVPLESAKSGERKAFQREAVAKFVGLIKESKERRTFAPADPESGPPNPWVDAWLRVDLPKIAAQLPYELLPFYLEVMNDTDSATAKSEIVRSDEQRGELFFLPNRVGQTEAQRLDPARLPIPSFDTVVPAGRHFGYVWEWGVMALVTVLVGLLLQLKPPRF